MKICRIVESLPASVLATCLLDQRLELLVDDIPQLDLVPVLLVQVDAPQQGALLVRLLQLLQQTECSGRGHSLVFVALSLAEVSKVSCPVPRHKQIQKLSVIFNL